MTRPDQSSQLPAMLPSRRLLLGGGAACAGLFLIAGCKSAGSAVAADGAAPAKPPAVGQRKLEKIGIQLWTVRDAYRADPVATLNMLAELGYSQIEYAHLEPYPILLAELRKRAEDLGMTIPAAHFGTGLFIESPQKIIDLAGELGARLVVNPWTEEHKRSRDDYYRHAEWFNRIGEQTKAAGIRYAYHNHQFEFDKKDGNLSGYDILVRNTDPALVQFELDMFWSVDAGQDNISIINAYPGRFVSCHIKDRAPAGTMTSVGDGIIPWAAIFPHIETAGLKLFFVENDNPSTPLRAELMRSANFLKQLRF
jgi:sugar phosphate isomerase/epimerase